MSASRSTTLLGGFIVLALAWALATTAGAASLTLSFTAPGDDGMAGRATRYDVRYSTSLINDANFSLAPRVLGLAAPQPAGTRETIVIPGLLENTIYWLAIKTVDDAGNWSGLSNVVMSPRTATSRGDTISVVAFSPPHPNPAKASVRFSFDLPRAGSVLLEAFDLSGRRVKTLFHGLRDAGANELIWDLRDDAGAPVKAGVYMVRAMADGRTFLQRLAVVR